MDRFYIITNDAKDRDFKLTEEIETYLTSHGKECRVQQAERRQRGKFHYTDPDLIPEGTQCILVLGGDGTLLQAARDVVHRDPASGNESGNSGISGRGGQKFHLSVSGSADGR